MVKVFTIKEEVPVRKFGFESSQLARQELFLELGVEHKLVLTNIDNLVPNFVEKLTDLGFKNFYHSIFYKQAGNSVAVPVISRIAKQIKLALEG